MTKFKKAYNIKIAFLAIATVILVNSATYPQSISSDTLRPPSSFANPEIRESIRSKDLITEINSINDKLIIPSIPDNVKGYGSIDCRHLLMTEAGNYSKKDLSNLSLKPWNPDILPDINTFKEYYKDMIEDIGLYVDKNDFIVLIVLNGNHDKNEDFINDSKRFNRNIIGHFSRLLKLMAEGLEKSNISNEHERLNLKTSQIAIYYTLMETFLLPRFSDIYAHLFRNSVGELNKMLDGTSKTAIAPGFEEVWVLKDILAKRDVFVNEMEELRGYVEDKLKTNPSASLSLDIYDIGAASGLFGAVMVKELDKLAKEKRIALNATFYILDPDLATFNKSGMRYYDNCEKKYSTTEREYGLNFTYIVPGDDRGGKRLESSKLGDGYAQEATFKKGGIVLTNDVYEHITADIQNTIISSMAKQEIGLHLVHVPYEDIPDSTWGHIRSFNHAELEKLGDFFVKEAGHYTSRVKDLNNGESGFLVVRRIAPEENTFQSILTMIKKGLSRLRLGNHL